VRVDHRQSGPRKASKEAMSRARDQEGSENDQGNSEQRTESEGVAKVAKERKLLDNQAPCNKGCEATEKDMLARMQHVTLIGDSKRAGTRIASPLEGWSWLLRCGRRLSRVEMVRLTLNRLSCASITRVRVTSVT
jgi:hypothetical protein